MDSTRRHGGINKGNGNDASPHSDTVGKTEVHVVIAEDYIYIYI